VTAYMITAAGCKVPHEGARLERIENDTLNDCSLNFAPHVPASPPPQFGV
jgi:hypothetical protein